MFILFLHNTPIIVDYIYLFPALLSSCQIEVFWSVGQQLKAPRSLLYMLSWDSLAAWLAWLREHNPSLLLSLSVLLFSFCPLLPCLWLVHCISRRYEYIHESRMNQLSEWRKQHDDDVFFWNVLPVCVIMCWNLWLIKKPFQGWLAQVKYHCQMIW